MRRFHLHQSVRRRLCRAFFCLACLVPTTVLLGWTVSRKLPTHVMRCEERLSELLGFDVHIQRVRYPQPGLCLYEGIELTDPESRMRVLRCRWIELGQTGSTLVIRPANVEVESGQAGRLVTLLMRRLQRELPVGGAMLRILSTGVMLRGPHDEQTYEDVECLVESTDTGDSATWRFRLAGVEMNEAATLIVTRRHSPQASTRVSLNTAGSSLPVSIFSAWLDWQSFLGRDALFRGSLWVDVDDRQTRADLAGELRSVDLEALVSARFPHVLTGSATLEIDRARVEQGRLAEAAGQFRCEQGVVGRSLIDSWVNSLACRTCKEPIHRAQAGNLNYRQLFLRFTLDASGLRLEGSSIGREPGTILAGEAGQPLLLEPIQQPMPLVAVVRALVPPSRTYVPATAETAALVPWLPLPPVVPPRNADGLPHRPSARVRVPDN